VGAMHTLYLLRHAKSSWSDPSLSDHDRPLAPRGRRDSKRIAKHLRRLEVSPTLVLCSSATRTRETFMFVQLALADALIQVEEELYAASGDALLERLRTVPDEVDSVLIIGHNPGLYDLALTLVSTGAELDRLEAKFPTAGFATLAVPRSPWSKLREGDAELVAYVVPKQLR
jgi:phosphohistidine phosphatase